MNADLAWWRATLRALAPLGDDELAPVEAALTTRDLRPGEHYLVAGARAKAAGLIRSGVVREHFVLPDGSERTRAFGVAGEFAGSLSDLLVGGPARTYVVAEAPTRILSVPWALLAPRLADGGWHTLLHRVLERLYLAKAEREYELLGLDAEERYRRFCARLPQIESLVAQRHVASYLGITPEHLSRVRARLGLQRPRNSTSAPAKPATKAAQRARSSGGSQPSGSAQRTAPRSGITSAIDHAITRSTPLRRGMPRPKAKSPK
jgi:CRP-like cAMP-binding protein